MWENEAVVDDAGVRDSSTTEPGALVRLANGVGLSDLAVEASDCGQYVMLMCGPTLVALMGAEGSDVDSVEFSDGRRYRVGELIDLVTA